MSEFHRLAISESDGVTVVRCVDPRIQDQALVQDWTAELKRLVEEIEEKKIVINLSNVQFLASAALNKLVVLNRDIKKLGGKFVLCEIHGPIRDMFSVTNLDKLLPLADTEDEAISICNADSN